jgi:hypothetical protein
VLTRPVTFQTDKAYGGFAEVQGQMRYEGDALVLEFQVKDSLFGALKSGVKELVLPLATLEDLSFKKGWFRHRMTIRTRSMADLSDLPGADGSILVVKIAKSDADAARDLASHVLLLLSEDRLRRLEEEARGI